MRGEDTAISFFFLLPPFDVSVPLCVTCTSRHPVFIFDIYSAVNYKCLVLKLSKKVGSWSFRVLSLWLKLNMLFVLFCFRLTLIPFKRMLMKFVIKSLWKRVKVKQKRARQPTLLLICHHQAEPPQLKMV